MDNYLANRHEEQTKLCRSGLKFIDRLKRAMALGLIVTSSFSGSALAQLAPDIQLLLLETQLNACYLPPVQLASEDDQVTVEILVDDSGALLVDDSGALIGTAKRNISRTESRGDDAIFEAAELAMLSCLQTKPNTTGETSVFQILFKVDEITVVMLPPSEGSFFSSSEAQDGSTALNDAFQQGISDIFEEESELSKKLARVEAAGQATEEGEAALALNRTARQEIQGRLSILGYDTRGVDGVFGRGSRGAIFDWQSEMPVTPTGFLNAAQISYLELLTADTYQDWLAARAAAAAARPRVFRGSDGCVRTRNDNRTRFIILGRSRHCNLRAFGLR